MIKQLIKLANHLDKIGLTEEAGGLDDVLQSILQMIEDKSIDIKQTEEGEEFVFDLWIDDKGNVVGADPAKDDELGDFSDLDETNITRDEAFSAGCAVCGDEEGLCDHGVE